MCLICANLKVDNYGRMTMLPGVIIIIITIIINIIIIIIMFCFILMSRV